jgi:hypothetical protein
MQRNPFKHLSRNHSARSPDGIAKLLAADFEASAKAGSCRHFGGVVRPETERIVTGVAI